MRKYIPIATFMLLLPALALAQGQDVWSLWAYFFRLILKITQLFWVLTTLVFLWGLVNFMKNAESDKERGNAKKMMIGSVVAFFLAVSFWGLVTFTIRTFGFNADTKEYQIPTTTSN